MRIPKPATKKARIEIIPMIDAIFFLLVFFMFSSLSMIRMRGANVSLPASQSGATGSGADSTPKLIVSVSENGTYFLNKRRTSREELQKLLQSEVSARPSIVIVVNMAKTQTTQALLDVLDSTNKVTTPSGASPSVLIATEPVDSQGQSVGAKAR